MTRKAAGASAEHTFFLETANSESGEVFRMLFEKSGLCMASLDSELNLLEVNTEFVTYFDLKSQEGQGRPFPALLHPTARKRIVRELSRLTGGERDHMNGKIVAVRQDGALLFGDMTAVSTTKTDGTVDTILVLVSNTSWVGREQAIVQRQVRMTPMDARILEGVAAGVSTTRLATSLHMSKGGVEYRVAALLRMLNAINRAELVSKAHSMGVLSTESWPPNVLPEFTPRLGS